MIDFLPNLLDVYLQFSLPVPSLLTDPWTLPWPRALILDFSFLVTDPWLSIHPFDSEDYLYADDSQIHRSIPAALLSNRFMHTAPLVFPQGRICLSLLRLS